MATLVTPLEAPRLTAFHPDSAAPPDLRFALPLVTALSLFAFLVSGYHPAADDGGLYLAGIERLLNPSLFAASASFVTEPTRFSLFAPLVASLVRASHLSLDVVVLALHLASIWTTLLAAWLLTARCWPSRAARSGALLLLACWLTLPVAGTALVLMDPYLTARSISTPCALFALVGCLGLSAHRSLLRSLSLTLFSLALAVAMHPLMGAYSLAFTLLFLALRSTHPLVRRYLPSALSLIAVAAAAVTQLAAPWESPVYRAIVLTRTYWFLSQWTWYELLGLAAPLAILALFARRSAKAVRDLARTALIAGSSATLIALLFAHASSATHLVARLQPLRIFHLVYLLMVLFLGATLGESVLRRSPWRWSAAGLLLASVMFLSARAAFPASNHIELPWIAPRNPWTQAFLWIRANTPRNALFALDADYINARGEDAQCFRALAQRSSLPDFSKDGGETSIAPALTAAWQAGQRAQQNLSAPSTTDTMRLAALTPLHVTWIVLSSQARTSLRCPYANSAVKICRLR